MDSEEGALTVDSTIIVYTRIAAKLPNFSEIFGGPISMYKATLAPPGPGVEFRPRSAAVLTLGQEFDSAALVHHSGTVML